MPTIGVYAIRNSVTGRVYIGGSTNIERRWRQHRESLNGGWKSATNHRLRDDWSRFGEGAFVFAVVEPTKTRAEMAIAEYCLTRDAITVGMPLYNPWPALYSHLSVADHDVVNGTLRSYQPRISTIRKLATALGVDPEELIADSQRSE